MTARERITAALNHQETDRVPVYPILAGITRKLVNSTYRDWSLNAETCANAYLEAVRRFDLDCVVTLIDLSVECEAWGQELIYPELDAAHPNYRNNIIKDIDDYAKIRKADIANASRMQMHIDVCRRLVAGLNDEVPVIAFVFGPLGTLSMLRNQQAMYMDIYDDPDAVRDAAREVCETLKDYCNALLDTGIDGIMFDTLFSSGSIMSKDMWKEMEGDLVAELAELVHARGKAVMIHNCGERIYMDAQIETMHPEAISFLYPADDCRSFAEVKEKYGDVTTLIGCVTPATAVIGSMEDWDRECMEQMDAMAPGGGFILSTGCEYPSASEFDRAERMIELARTYTGWKK